MSDSKGHSNWSHAVEFSHVYIQTKLETNWFTSVPTEANVEGICHKIMCIELILQY